MELICIWTFTKIELACFCHLPNSPTKFRPNPSISFWDILHTDKHGWKHNLHPPSVAEVTRVHPCSYITNYDSHVNCAVQFAASNISCPFGQEHTFNAFPHSKQNGRCCEPDSKMNNALLDASKCPLGKAFNGSFEKCSLEWSHLNRD